MRTSFNVKFQKYKGKGVWRQPTSLKYKGKGVWRQPTSLKYKGKEVWRQPTSLKYSRHRNENELQYSQNGSVQPERFSSAEQLHKTKTFKQEPDRIVQLSFSLHLYSLSVATNAQISAQIILTGFIKKGNVLKSPNVSINHGAFWGIILKLNPFRNTNKIFICNNYPMLPKIQYYKHSLSHQIKQESVDIDETSQTELQINRTYKFCITLLESTITNLFINQPTRYWPTVYRPTNL